MTPAALAVSLSCSEGVLSEEVGLCWELLAVVAPHQYFGDSKNSGTGGRAPFSEVAILPDLLTPGL